MKRLTFSYRLSTPLTESLEQITALRQEILLTPLLPKTDLRYRWEALIEKIYWSLSLDGESLSKSEIVTILTDQKKKNLSPIEMDIYRYRYGYDYLHREWLGSKKPITARTIQRLYELIGRGKLRDEASLKAIIEYMQSSTEHPVMQAAIILIELIKKEPFTKDNDRIARLAAYLFLYKYGYDVDESLVLGEFLKRESKTYEDILAKVSKDSNITPWLEFLARGIAAQLMEVRAKITEQNLEAYLPVNLFDLTDRQQAILSFLNKPGSRITNKKCTSLFKISQITASRELSKMASMGLLFTHGRGRSVYYTKV
jgi:Fic family protein